MKGGTEGTHHHLPETNGFNMSASREARSGKRTSLYGRQLLRNTLVENHTHSLTEKGRAQRLGSATHERRAV